MPSPSMRSSAPLSAICSKKVNIPISPPAASPPEINFACEPVEARALCAARSSSTNGSTLGSGRAKYSLFGSFQISHARICGYRRSAAAKNRSKAVMSVG